MCVSIMPAISLSVHNVFLDAKREWVCVSIHMTADHNLVECESVHMCVYMCECVYV